jgi:hypothetical protein
MPRIAYRYSILKYLHDPAAGESLNIGVLFYCPQMNLLRLKVGYQTKRLSEAFGAFDLDGYRRTISGMEHAAELVADEIATSSSRLPMTVPPPPESIEEVLPRILFDKGMAYAFGPELYGVCRNPETEVEQLYERYVLSRYTEDGPRKRRVDNDVWNRFRESLFRENIAHLVTERVIRLEDDFEYKFSHSLGRKAVFEPISFDYADRRMITERVTEVLGLGQLMQAKREEVGKVYFLVGPPTDEKLLKSYESALKLLRSFVLHHEIVTEDRSEDVAEEVREIAEEMVARVTTKV